MREVSFIMPSQFQSGYAHTALRKALLEAFGGYTARRVDGAWLDDGGKVTHDNSFRYTIAHIWTPSLRHKLIDIVMATGKHLRQQCVYFVWEDGEAEILDV